MEKRTIPLLDRDKESLVIINTLMPEFYDYLKTKPSALNKLLALQVEGNEKAGQVMAYLTENSDEVFTTADMQYSKLIHGKTSGGDKIAYHIFWNEPVVNNTNRNKPFVTFEISVLFENPLDQFDLEYPLKLKKTAPLTKQFLMDDITTWLKEKGFKIRHYDTIKNHGHIYANVSIKLFDTVPHPLYKHLKLTNKASAKCIVEILPL